MVGASCSAPTNRHPLKSVGAQPKSCDFLFQVQFLFLQL